jgi:ribose 5-phosphate isomerase B
MKITLASDHAGYSLKQHLVNYLKEQGHNVLDLGVNSPYVSADYPDAAEAVGQAVLDGRAERGIILCGSGIGVSIAANKISGIYAAICHDIYSAHQGVEHDRMNVICMGAHVIGQSLAEEIATTFINAQVDDEERYARRFHKVQAIEKRKPKSHGE